MARVAAAMAISFVAAGCGIQAESSPRDVPDGELANFAGTDAGEAAAGAERIYLIEPGDEQLLKSVQREAGSPQELIEVLLRGPNTDELGDQFTTAIPTGLELRSLRAEGAFLTVDVSEQLLSVSGRGLVQALAQIVYTATELDGVQSVLITVEGDRIPWPKANLETTLGALQIYDYPGLVRSAQPAYPSVPSG